jgi:hypothetical protein
MLTSARTYQQNIHLAPFWLLSGEQLRISQMVVA